MYHPNNTLISTLTFLTSSTFQAEVSLTKGIGFPPVISPGYFFVINRQLLATVSDALNI
jgi:hypothetical protein